jgi:beta-ribofuranosylaminobenzene 5'-phosphate synthase
MRSSTTVIAPARLHLGLFDLGNATSRTFGGVGLMIENPPTVVTVRRSSATRIEGGSLSDDARLVLERRVLRFVERQGFGPVSVQIENHAPEHVGLGSKTSLILATLTAISELSEVGQDHASIRLASGRGGTSGIGINGFFTGGFLVDAGHRGKRPWLPSAHQSPSGTPVMVTQMPIPIHWRISLFLPDGRRLSGSDEAAFFQRSTPIPRLEVFEQIAIAYHELAPAVIDDDLDAFGDALQRLSRLGLKSREITNQGPQVAYAMTRLREIVPCVGMSSMGPLLFAISRDEPPIEFLGLHEELGYMGCTLAANQGYRARHDESRS